MELLKDRMRWALKRAGISQAALARAVGVKAPSVNAWCSGETKTIEGENLMRAAQALKVNPYWLATGKGSREPLSAGEVPTDHLLGETITAGLASPPSHSMTLDPGILFEAERWVLFEEGPVIKGPGGVERLKNPYPPRLRAERLSALYAMIAADGGTLSPANSAALIEAAKARPDKGVEGDRVADRGIRAANK